MPESGVALLPKENILDFEEIERLCQVFAGLGVRRIRLTGGEPTIRKRVVELVKRIASVSGIEEVVMTTNGHRLPELAWDLLAAGLRGVNVSLDTLDEKKFRLLTRRGDLNRVVTGIEAARSAGLSVKVNTVLLRSQNIDELGSLCAFAWDNDALPRFIEHMPMSGGDIFTRDDHVSAAEVRERIADHFGERLVAGDGTEIAGPAKYWTLERTKRRFGIISAMTEHFCGTCNRVRLSATGDLHTCLAYDDATSLRELLRGGATDEAVAAAIRRAVGVKRDGHDFQLSGAGAPRKHMISIGG